MYVHLHLCLSTVLVYVLFNVYSLLILTCVMCTCNVGSYKRDPTAQLYGLRSEHTVIPVNVVYTCGRVLVAAEDSWGVRCKGGGERWRCRGEGV